MYSQYFLHSSAENSLNFICSQSSFRALRTKFIISRYSTTYRHLKTFNTFNLLTLFAEIFTLSHI